MQVERIKLENIKQQDHLVVLEGMEVGESLFFEDERKAQSIRAAPSRRWQLLGQGLPGIQQRFIGAHL